MAAAPGRGKSWVLAMLAPKRSLRVAPVPPKTADLTRPGAAARTMAGRDEGTGISIEPRNNRAHRGLAVAIARRLQSLAQWWVRLTKPHTQKFGYSPWVRAKNRRKRFVGALFLLARSCGYL